MHMTYETPAITELGSVADFTRADSLARIDDDVFGCCVGDDRTLADQLTIISR